MKKFNLSEIMKRAWAIVKQTGATISAALRKSWAIAKEAAKMDSAVKKLEGIGGKRWQKGGMDRIYFNAYTIMSMIDFVVDYYKTGNVRSASIDGEVISNSRARSYIWELKSAKIWVDVSDLSVHTKGIDATDYIGGLAINAIKTAMEG